MNNKFTKLSVCCAAMICMLDYGECSNAGSDELRGRGNRNDIKLNALIGVEDKLKNSVTMNAIPKNAVLRMEEEKSPIEYLRRACKEYSNTKFTTATRLAMAYVSDDFWMLTYAPTITPKGQDTDLDGLLGLFRMLTLVKRYPLLDTFVTENEDYVLGVLRKELKTESLTGYDDHDNPAFFEPDHLPKKFSVSLDMLGRMLLDANWLVPLWTEPVWNSQTKHALRRNLRNVMLGCLRQTASLYTRETDPGWLCVYSCASSPVEMMLTAYVAGMYRWFLLTAYPDGWGEFDDYMAEFEEDETNEDDLGETQPNDMTAEGLPDTPEMNGSTAKTPDTETTPVLNHKGTAPNATNSPDSSAQRTEDSSPRTNRKDPLTKHVTFDLSGTNTPQQKETDNTEADAAVETPTTKNS